MNGSKSIRPSTADAQSQSLCLNCGLCCDGTIFADIKLHSGDKPDHLKTLAAQAAAAASSNPQPSTGQTGSVLNPQPRGSASNNKLPQPCVFFNRSTCKCSIYPERPRYCRDFRCLLLDNVAEHRLSTQAALAVITDARHKAQSVRNLLHTLGDTDERSPISTRFTRTSRRLETLGAESETADTFGELTVAMHELHLVLSESFYR